MENTTTRPCDQLVVDISDINRALPIVKEAAIYYGCDPVRIVELLNEGRDIPLITGAILRLQRWEGRPIKLLVVSMSWDTLDLVPYRPGYTPHYVVIVNGKRFGTGWWSFAIAHYIMERIIDSIPIRDATVLLKDMRTNKTRQKWLAIGPGEWVRPMQRFSYTEYSVPPLRTS